MREISIGNAREKGKSATEIAIDIENQVEAALIEEILNTKMIITKAKKKIDIKKNQRINPRAKPVRKKKTERKILNQKTPKAEMLLLLFLQVSRQRLLKRMWTRELRRVNFIWMSKEGF